MHVTYNVPKQCLINPCGLIIDVHGLAMSGEIEDANTNMRALGEQHGYIVAQPTASPNVVPFNHWGPEAEEELVGFVNLVLSEPTWKIDRNRVHHMGFSEGASLTWDMHARHADLFASVVAMEYGHTQFSSSMTQIPVLYQNGKLDPNWPLIAKQTVEAITTAWDLDAGSILAEDDTFSHTPSPSAIKVFISISLSISMLLIMLGLVIASLAAMILHLPITPQEKFPWLVPLVALV